MSARFDALAKRAAQCIRRGGALKQFGFGVADAVLTTLVRTCSLVGLLPLSLFADSLDNWHWRNPLPNSHAIKSVTYGNGKFVAVGDIIATTSADGINWISTGLGRAHGDLDLNAVSYGNRTFVAVGSGDRKCIFTSTDGVHWVAHEFPGVQSSLGAIVYGNGLFVALGYTVLTSPDGTNWTNSDQMSDPSIGIIAFGGGTFVAVGALGKILTSSDGVNWTARTSGTTADLTSVTYGNGIFVTVGGAEVLTSTNAINWISHSEDTAAELLSVTYGNGTFVAVGANGTIFSSTNAIVWTPRSSGTTHRLGGSTYGNGSFVAVGDEDENTAVIVTSPDGVNWTTRSSGATEALDGIAYGNGTFVAVGENGTILSGNHGSNWMRHNSGTASSLYGATYGGDLFVAVGEGGTILTSEDAAGWTSRSSGTTVSLNGIAYVNDLFLAVGNYGTILASTNGINWTAHNSGTIGWLAGAAYGNGTFVAVGVTNILTSADAVNWTTRNSGLTDPFRQQLQSVAYGNGVFIAVGYQWSFRFETTYGIILTSTNAIDWAFQRPSSSGLFGIAFGHSTFVAAGVGCDFDCFESLLLSSTNGTDWIPHHSGTYRNLLGVARGNGSFVVVGLWGTILQSEEVVARLVPLPWSGHGSFAFDLEGEPAQSYQLEASSDLAHWTALTNFISATGTNQFSDAAAASFGRRFYRAVTP